MNCLPTSTGSVMALLHPTFLGTIHSLSASYTRSSRVQVTIRKSLSPSLSPTYSHRVHNNTNLCAGYSSLFSTIMPTQKLLKKQIAHRSKKRSFLSIPPELRNFIYQYHYDTVQLIELMPKMAPYRVLEAYKFDFKGTSNQGNDALKQGIRSGNLLGQYNRATGMKTRWHLSISGLHLVNKQISAECLDFLYACIMLMTQSYQRLSNFLTVVPKKNLKQVTRLQLDHQTYGHPQYLHDEIWKKRHDETWSQTCKLAVTKLPGLTQVTINIDIRDVPLRFTLNQPWAKPMLFFAHRKATLEDIKINVITPELASTVVDSKDWKTWKGYQPWYVRILKERHEGAVEMHRLFGRAIKKKIEGFCDDCAMEEYLEALKEKFDGDAHKHASNTAGHNGD